MKTSSRGFTLIEILIVVAIIAILASVVLVGLGPTQAKGRDARRISDLQETQNALELYYNKNGSYPNVTQTGSAGWAQLSTDITGAGIGITQPLSNDPTNSGQYVYYYYSATPYNSYDIGACLEGSDPSGYNPITPPSAMGMTCSSVSSTYVLSM